MGHEKRFVVIRYVWNIDGDNDISSNLLEPDKHEDDCGENFLLFRIDGLVCTSEGGCNRDVGTFMQISIPGMVNRKGMPTGEMEL